MEATIALKISVANSCFGIVQARCAVTVIGMDPKPVTMATLRITMAVPLLAMCKLAGAALVDRPPAMILAHRVRAMFNMFDDLILAFLERPP